MDKERVVEIYTEQSIQQGVPPAEARLIAESFVKLESEITVLKTRLEAELIRKDELLKAAGKLAELIKYATWPVSEGTACEMVVQADAFLTTPEVVKVMEGK